MSTSPADLTSIKNASKLINERLAAQGFFPIQKISSDKSKKAQEHQEQQYKKLDRLYFPSIDWKYVTKSLDQLGGVNEQSESAPDLDVTGPTDVMYENDKKILNVIYSLLDTIEMNKDLKESVVSEAQEQQSTIQRLDAKVKSLLHVIEEKNKEIHSLHAANIKLENDAQIMNMKSKNAVEKLMKVERDFKEYRDFSIREARRNKFESERQSKRVNYLVSKHKTHSSLNSSDNETPAAKRRQLPLREVQNPANKENIQTAPSSSSSSSDDKLMTSSPHTVDPQLMASFAHLQDINSNLTHEMAKMYCWVLKVYELLASWNHKLKDDGEEADKDNTFFRLSKSKKNLLERLSTSDQNTIDSFAPQDYLITVPKSFVPSTDSDILSFDSRLFELSKVDKKFINILNQLASHLFDVIKIGYNGSVSSVSNNNNNNNKITLNDTLNEVDGDTFVIKTKKRSVKEDQIMSRRIKELQMENSDLKKNYEQALKTMNEWKTFRAERPERI